MQQTWQHILDGAVRRSQEGHRRFALDAFTAHSLQRRNLPEVLFSLMLSALLRQDYDPSAVLEIVRRTLYS